MILWPWLVWLAAGLALELAGALSNRDRMPTLTDVIRKYVPKVMIASALVWLAAHFGVS